MNQRLLTLLLTAVLLATGRAPSASPKAAGFTFEDWHVNTAQFDYNWQSGAFTAPDQLTLTRPGSSIRADRAFGNQKTKQATLTGNVVLHDTNGVLTNFAGQGGSHAPATLTCDNLAINGVTKSYVATGNVHFIQGSSDVRADRAVMNGVTHQLDLYGHVQLQQ